MEIAAQKRAFEDMKEVSDRALKLAETSKKAPWVTGSWVESSAWPGSSRGRS